MGQTRTPEDVIAGIGQRIEAVIRAEAGKPLVRAKKNPPLKPDRGNYVRGYSYSMMAFAARCLYLGERLEEANAALVENARHYLDNPKDIPDRDSFHWHAETVLRLIEMYGPEGSTHAGRLTEETVETVLKPIWIYTKACSWLEKAEYEKSKTWHLYCSENHHTMDFTIHWQFAKLAKDRPEYKDQKCDDGATLAEHYEAWNEYFVQYCVERARRSPCVEMMSDGYNSTMIKGIYNFYDFGDKRVKRAAGMLLDLFWAYWAQEQIAGAQGGGKSRIYFFKGFKQNRSHGTAPLAWLYFGIGEQPKLNGHDVNMLLSAYRPPALVADIALDVEGRGRYEVRQRPQGRATQGHTFPMMDRPDKSPTRFRTDGGGIVRYSFCDPAFIMGTLFTEARPKGDWALISTQNRWQGVVFADDARIVPIPRPKDARVAFNGFWSVQSKGSLITQKLKYCRGGTDMIVWLSKAGLSDPVEEGGAVFVENAGAYAAIRVASGGHRWMKGEFNTKRHIPEHNTMILKDDTSAVILDVMAKGDVESLDSFKAKVLSCPIEMDKSIVKYKTIYGDTLTLHTACKRPPSINGTPVDYTPPKVFESPFLNSDYASGVVRIQKGERERTLDFNELLED